MENKNAAAGDANLAKALEHLNSLLVAGETIEAWAVQPRLFALYHRRCLIAATSGRFIKIGRGLLGGFDMSDFRWQDLQETNIKVGIFGADIYFKVLGSSDFSVNEFLSTSYVVSGYLKEQAQGIYRIAQYQEQAWREKRRVRELEETRARSGGINLGNFGGSQPTSNSGDSPALKLQQAKQMLDSKLITDAEYEAIKARVISGL